MEHINMGENLQKIRHSASHVLADAVQRLYPGVKLGMGPAIEDGFYYDFDFSGCKAKGRDERKGFFLKPEDLTGIEKQMSLIIKEKNPFKKEIVSKKDAGKIFTKAKEPYKLELLRDIKEEEVSLYRHGAFCDLCKGPHVSNTSEIQAFKLLSLAGAYWKANEKNKMLQRIYGTAFYDKKSLDEFLKLQEEAQKRDHRKLGKDLDLFSFNETAGAGFVLYHPKGALLRQIIADYITRKHIEKGYDLISSPHILKSDIWIKSGHYDYYKENMYIFEKDGQEFAVKPMNCPGHILVYSSRMRSYKDLPIRYFELGNVYRHEKSGVLHGLLRVRGFTQDDAHIFCLREQVETEVIKVMEFVQEVLNVFGFKEFEVELSTRPERYIGTENDWNDAEDALRNALKTKSFSYKIHEQDGAFYGPKIDIRLKDALNRAWQCATIQCDFALPERFDLKYIAPNGKEKRPAVLHRVVLGSLERFIGALIEHYSGDFPLWLAPVQIMVIPVSEGSCEYGEAIKQELLNGTFRAELDKRDEKMQRKIRDAEMEKVPYMAVVGEREMQSNTVSLRSRKEQNTKTIPRAELMAHLAAEAADKK